MRVPKKIKAEVSRLCRAEQRALRDWLNHLLANRLKLKGGSKAEITTGTQDLLAGLDQLFAEIPATGPSHPVDLAKIIVEDRGGSSSMTQAF